MKNMSYTLENILRVCQERGLPVFTNDKKDYNLNLVGVRTKDLKSNTFNDFMFVIWKYKGAWNMLSYNITTDPGTYWRENPMNADGTAILKEGYHKAIWKMGLHKGQYPALVQHKPCEVYRDNNGDGILDTEFMDTQVGLFGINCHRSNASAISTQVDKWSAGCQVHDDPNRYHNFMAICDKAAANWGNSFSYKLLLEEWF